LGFAGVADEADALADALALSLASDVVLSESTGSFFLHPGAAAARTTTNGTILRDFIGAHCCPNV
jgi:hypothetical protein